MRSYAIDTLFDSEYYIGDTEEIETTEALQAPDSEHFITAKTLQTYHQKAGRRIRREQRQQEDMENPHNTQVQKKEEVKRRTG